MTCHHCGRDLPESLHVSPDRWERMSWHARRQVEKQIALARRHAAGHCISDLHRTEPVTWGGRR